MTITCETLALAAKAAGIEVRGWPSDFPVCLILKDNEAIWQPHTDHGQLLDLAMACEIGIRPSLDCIEYSTWIRRAEVVSVDCQDFPVLAEAIITAAAEQQLVKEQRND